VKESQFHPADDLWGLDTYATEDRIKEWIKANRPGAKKCGVVVIGPAGENQVRFAVIWKTIIGVLQDVPESAR